MAKINFKTQLFKIGKSLIGLLPIEASEKLPSRSMVMVDGSINDELIQTALEPDGRGSHWFRVDSVLAKKLKLKEGDGVKLSVEPSKEWPEPKIPADLKTALSKNLSAKEVWLDTTVKARWEWIRWIRATKNPETRKIRVEKAMSKMKSGMRRPCCFNTRMCTVPSVSKSGVLLDTK